MIRSLDATHGATCAGEVDTGLKGAAPPDVCSIKQTLGGAGPRDVRRRSRQGDQCAHGGNVFHERPPSDIRRPSSMQTAASAAEMTMQSGIEMEPVKTVSLSYRRSDQACAPLVFRCLRDAGCDVFIDFDGLGGGEFPDASATSATAICRRRTRASGHRPRAGQRPMRTRARRSPG